MFKNIIFLRVEHLEFSFQENKYEINNGLGHWLYEYVDKTKRNIHTYNYLNQCGILTFSSTCFKLHKPIAA